jgi:putative heme iron utilization protein
MLDLGKNNALAARRVLRLARLGTLASLDAASGHPYASLASYATEQDGTPLFLFSRLSDHTKNLLADGRASLLASHLEGFANPQEGPRLSLEGRIEPADTPDLKARYLARHPKAALYAGFADFALYRLRVERAHLVGGFGRAIWLSAQDLLLPPAQAAHFAAAEAQILPRLTLPEGRAVALDADGIEVEQGDKVLRRLFQSPLAAPEEALDAAFLQS